MRSISGRKLLVAAAAALILPMASRTARAEVKVGDPAPAFSLPGSDGKTYSLDQFKGKSAVVLAWFPKAFTGGCTKECKAMREQGKLIREYQAAYFTASTDKPDVNKKFAESLELDYPILSDPDKSVAREYGVVHGSRAVPERWTFYIGKDGLIKEIDKGVQQHTETAGKDIAAKLKELGIEAK
jgi:peroxiredoxin Q/BCP